MSANKSAHALVGLLNDLFGALTVVGRPNVKKSAPWETATIVWLGVLSQRADHAYCCIEMGLGMIRAIEQFCQEKKEMVNMR